MDVNITTTNRNVIVTERSIDVVVQDNVIQVDIIGGPGPVGADGARYIGHSTEYFASMPVDALQTFQVETGLAFTPAQWVVIYPEPASSSNYSFGFVDSYNSLTGVLVIYVVFNDGNPATDSWIINLSGPQGPQGTGGDIGERGESTSWSNGEGAPIGPSGTEGSYYLDTLTGDVYLKATGSTWNIVANIKGPQGDQGPAGVAEVYSATLGSVTSATIASATHGITEVKNVTIYHPDGNEVSVPFSVVTNDVIINSNINLLNHIIKIY